MNDLRVPIGLFFGIVGLILECVGLLSDARAPLTDVNVNLYTGSAMIVFS